MGNLVFLLTFLLSSLAYAQDVNLLKNSDFESRLSRWAKTGSSTLVVQSASPLEGSYSADWDASATGEFLRSNTYTITEGLKGRRCSIEMEYLWAGTSGHLLMNVDDGTNNIAQVTLEPTTGGVSQKALTNFECPTSGTLRLEIESTANASSIRVDKMYLGSSKNITNISQANFVGSAYIDTTASCTWSRTNTALGAFTTTAACPGPTVELNPGVGTIGTSDTDLPRFTLNNLPPGTYRITVQAGAITNGATNTVCLAVNDGTDTRGRSCQSNVAGQAAASATVEAIFTYTSTANRTFEVFGSSSTSTVVLNNSANNQKTVFSIFKYPTSSAEALTLETTGSSWSGYFDDTCSWSRTNTAVGAFTDDASCALVELTNSGFGSVTAAGSVSPAITFTPKQIGKYYVCARPQTEGSNITEHNLLLTDGTNDIAYSSYTNTGNTHQRLQNLCGFLNVTSISAVTLTIQGSSGAGSITIRENTNSSNTGRSIEWAIFPISQQFPSPVFTELQNLVKTPGANYSIYSSTVTTSTDVTTNESGDWINGNCTNAGAGLSTCTYQSGIFSATPVCSAMVNKSSAASTREVSCTAGSSSVTCVGQIGGAAGGSDIVFDIICHGPR